MTFVFHKFIYKQNLTQRKYPIKKYVKQIDIKIRKKQSYYCTLK